MPSVTQTEAFKTWLSGLRDARARTRIVARVDRLANGLSGDVKPVGDGVLELRIDYGPGYRVYHVYFTADEITLLWGGDKQTQVRDIAKAKRMVKEI